MAIYSKRAWVSWVSRGRAPRSFCAYLVLPFFFFITLLHRPVFNGLAVRAVDSHQARVEVMGTRLRGGHA